MNLSRLRLATVLSLASAGLPGCGGGDSGGALSEAEYRKEGNATPDASESS